MAIVLRVFSLTQLCLAWFFGQREQAFIGAPFCLCLLALPGFWLLQSQVWDNEAKRKPSAPYLRVISKVPRSPACLPFSLHLSVFLGLPYIQHPGFLVVLHTGIGKSTSTPSSYKWKSLKNIIMQCNFHTLQWTCLHRCVHLVASTRMKRSQQPSWLPCPGKHTF